ncbi:MAG: peptidylprolyl isomerase [Rhodospirillales bacterium]|nr:peptidylprolyl isomerase [Rhodospirillales bacterium]
MGGRFNTPGLILAAALVLGAVPNAGVFGGGAANAAGAVGNARRVVNKVFGDTLSKTILPGEKVIENQRLRTGRESAADIRFNDQSTLMLGELSNVVLDQLVYDPRAEKISGSLELLKGMLRFASAAAVKVDLKVVTEQGSFGIRGTAFDLLTGTGFTELQVHEGLVQVQTPFGGADVSAGESYRMTNAAPPVAQSSPSEMMTAAAAKMTSLLDVPADAATGRRAKGEAQAETAGLMLEAPAYKRAMVGKDLSKIVYLDTSAGRLVIEMRPDLAPIHVKRIKELVHAKFYDGLIFHNVESGFAAETGDPTGTGLGGSGKQLKAEISKGKFVRGVVGMKHDRGKADTADSQFFITLGDAAHLDGKYTIWGHVIYGIDQTDLFRRGSPPSHPDRIISMRLAADQAK